MYHNTNNKPYGLRTFLEDSPPISDDHLKGNGEKQHFSSKQPHISQSLAVQQNTLTGSWNVHQKQLNWVKIKTHT